MLFHTPEFLFYFLPAALLLHRLALIGSPNSYSTLARFCLLVATLVFYGWTHTWWLLPFAFSVVFDFVWATLPVPERGGKSSARLGERGRGGYRARHFPARREVPHSS